VGWDSILHYVNRTGFESKSTFTPFSFLFEMIIRVCAQYFFPTVNAAAWLVRQRSELDKLYEAGVGEMFDIVEVCGNFVRNGQRWITAIGC